MVEILDKTYVVLMSIFKRNKYALAFCTKHRRVKSGKVGRVIGLRITLKKKLRKNVQDSELMLKQQCQSFNGKYILL